MNTGLQSVGEYKRQGKGAILSHGRVLSPKGSYSNNGKQKLNINKKKKNPRNPVAEFANLEL